MTGGTWETQNKIKPGAYINFVSTNKTAFVTLETRDGFYLLNENGDALLTESGERIKGEE